MKNNEVKSSRKAVCLVFMLIILMANFG